MEKKIGIVYHYFAHYRLPVFQELMSSQDINYKMISDKLSRVNIKTISPNLADKSLEAGGLRWKFVKNIWLYKESFLWQAGLLKILRKEPFDAVIFLGNVYYLSTWIAILVLKIKGKKIFFWTHGVTSDKKGPKWFIRKVFYNLSNGLFLYGNKAKEIMISNGLAEKKLHVIYNSLDYNKQLQLRALINDHPINSIKGDLFKNSKLPLVVFVGRLTKQKKLDMIVEASRKLINENFLINTLFIGDGGARKDLESLVATYELEAYFNFYGACYDETILAQLIGASDICVSPGEVGLTAMTALGYGTPVISHDDFNHQMPEYEAIIPGFNGELFKHGSIDSLAQTIKKWIIDNKNKPREKIRENCFHIIDTKYNPKNQVSIINDIIAKL